MSIRPFVFKINAAEFFSVVNSLNQKQRSTFLLQFSTDLITLSPVTDYGKKVVAETIDFIKKQSDYGKKGGKPKHKQPIGSLRAAPREPTGCPYPKEEVYNKEIYKEIIDDLNQKGSFKFQVSDGAVKLINGRISDGFTKEDFFKVHSNKIAKWKGTKWSEYLRPKTLYLPDNFQSYLNEEPPAKMRRFLNADGEYCEEPA